MPRMRPRLDFGIHGIDELADRDVGVVAVHEVDIDIVGLQPVRATGRVAWRSHRDSRAANVRPCRSARSPRAAPAGWCASRRRCSPSCRRHRRRRCRRHCRRPRRRRRAVSDAAAKFGKNSKPSVTTEAGLEMPGIWRCGTLLPRRDSSRRRGSWSRLSAFSTPYSRPIEARHWSRTRRLPRESAQLMPGEREFLLAGADRVAGRVRPRRNRASGLP